MDTSKDNPFYSNHVFKKIDIDRAIIKWWQYPLLWFIPTYVQISDGYAFKFKRTPDGRVWIMGFDKLGQPKSGGENETSR